MKERDTPLKLVRLWEKMLPGIYKTLDGLKAAKGSEELDWPDSCDLPIGAAFACLVEQEQLTPPEAAIAAAELTACYTWRKNKIVFSFDQDFAQMLVQQVDDVKDTDVLPTEIIFHLPYPCIYYNRRKTPSFSSGDTALALDSYAVLETWRAPCGHKAEDNFLKIQLLQMAYHI